ncbi:zinc finger CCCH domain-containing protein 55 [Punica granatum]|uniref:Zinc finger CCCH domain-containing protein 55 n=2 Tax=Punica granatum TaxID=22663 RepID=A0A6P8DV70_PUNGR|nr:zinc finger CCCH domain-containing protein 55 [Punica granatum]XP_031401357.1 zinc finger CCCH domain-containing protein 55 [Punica granatum]
MDANEATSIVLSKIKGIDPDNATKIMGYLLIQDLSEKDLIRIALGPETMLHSLIIKAKSQLGLMSSNSPAPSTPPSPSPLLGSMSRPSNPGGGNAHFMPISSPRLAQRSDFELGMSPRNPIWSGPISPSTSPSLPFGSSSSFYSGNSSGSAGGSRDFVDEQQMSDFFPFLNDTGNSSSSESHLHRRSFSESDACFGSEDGPFCGGAHRPCHYFARGFCKNGSGCKFVHSDDFEGSMSALSGSPSSFDAAEQMMRLKLAHQQRLASAAAAATQFAPGSSPISQSKYMNFLLQQHGDPHRLGMMIGDEIYKYGRYQQDRNDYMVMGMADKLNSASRQIYLTFPADSTFKDEDVSEYFSTYGPVQDVRIPYQQKRMFGFVTFVYPETVKMILNKGNPHFICNSRVLVKPYKEKGKVPEKRQLHHQQQFERGDFSPSSNSSMLDSGEPFDHLGARLLNNTHELILRRRLEEQQHAEFQQAIELQGRRLMNLQLPDLKNDNMYNHHHHLRSLSMGSSAPISIHVQHNLNHHKIFRSSEAISQEGAEDTNCGSPAPAPSPAAAASEQQLQKETNAACNHTFGSGERKDECSNPEGVGNQETLEHILPDSPFASPTKSTGNRCSDFTDETCESSTKAPNDPDREAPLTIISSGDGPPQ